MPRVPLDFQSGDGRLDEGILVEFDITLCKSWVEDDRFPIDKEGNRDKRVSRRAAVDVSAPRGSPSEFVSDGRLSENQLGFVVHLSFSRVNDSHSEGPLTRENDFALSHPVPY